MKVIDDAVFCGSGRRRSLVAFDVFNGTPDDLLSLMPFGMVPSDEEVVQQVVGCGCVHGVFQGANVRRLVTFLVVPCRRLDLACSFEMFKMEDWRGLADQDLKRPDVVRFWRHCTFKLHTVF